MWKTVLFLILALVVAPFIAFKFDSSPTDIQQSVLYSLILIYLSLSLLCFIISSITSNYSQVDKLWSVAPIAYSWVVAHNSGYESRLVIMATLVSLWGIRLTYNFYRRGGLSLKLWEGEEDYRWAILQAKPEFQPKWKWVLFNFFFISFYQMGLILLFTLPIVRSIGGEALGIWDYVLVTLFLIFIMIETMADQQQWIYQNEKHRLISTGEILESKYAKGFVQSGLWSYVRHPNYAAEQAIWIVFYLFSVVASGQWINWSIMGCLLLILLFKGSSDFSEEITESKYPAYMEYKNTTPRFIPFIK